MDLDIGNKLKILRRTRGISQDDLSKALAISKTNIARYETNKQVPSAEIVKKLAEYFEVSADYLLFSDTTNNPPAQIKNKNLLKQFEEVDRMDDYHRNLVIGLIDCIIAKQKISEIASQQQQNISQPPANKETKAEKNARKRLK